VASYDSPGYQNLMPGVGSRDEWMTGPGSTPSGIPDTSAEPTVGTVGNSALVVPYGSSVLNGDRVTVGPSDVNIGRQQDLYSGSDGDALTGLPGDLIGQTGAGQGSVGGPRHPNAMTPGSLAAQAEAARRPS
jgi:hypothetical protein